MNSQGQGFVEVTHSIHGLAWEVQQVGLGLGKAAPSPQVAALINGVPYVTTVVMGTSVFANMPGAAPIAMSSEFTGPPYPILEAGDKLTVGVTGAIAGDVFTVVAYVNELPSPAAQKALSSNNAGFVPRPGTRRW